MREQAAEQRDRPVEIVERDELVRGVRLTDVTGTDDDRIDSMRLIERGLGPEIERANTLDERTASASASQ